MQMQTIYNTATAFTVYISYHILFHYKAHSFITLQKFHYTFWKITTQKHLKIGHNYISKVSQFIFPLVLILLSL